MNFSLSFLTLLCVLKHSSTRLPANYINTVIKSVENCKNLKSCDVKKIDALSLDVFPEALKKVAELAVKLVVLLEKQTKKVDKKIGENLMNAIMIGLDAASKAQKTYSSSFNRVLTAISDSLKMMKGVEEVMLSSDSKNSCVIQATLKKYSRAQCQICQKMIPDFLDRSTAAKVAEKLTESIKEKAPGYIQDYLGAITTFAGQAAVYLDKLGTCVLSGKSVESCRKKDEEETLAKRTSLLLNMGKGIGNFMKAIGTTITSEIRGFVGRVTTTHQAYRKCLQSGVPASVSLNQTHLKLDLVKQYEEKVKDSLKPLDEVAGRALQTKMRMLRERRLVKARSMRN